MTITELIKLLKDNELGGISGKSRIISVTINDELFIAEPKITISSTGDGIAGAEICLDFSGEVKADDNND